MQQIKQLQESSEVVQIKQLQEFSEVAQIKLPIRPKLKLSNSEIKSIKDIDSMFGVWKEVDHCD